MRAQGFRCVITPSETRAVCQVRKLLPEHRMDYGSWTQPGYVFDVTVEELALVNALLADEGIRLILQGA
jgi:hypothetical protein